MSRLIRSDIKKRVKLSTIMRIEQGSKQRLTVSPPDEMLHVGDSADHSQPHCRFPGKKFGLYRSYCCPGNRYTTIWLRYITVHRNRPTIVEDVCTELCFHSLQGVKYIHAAHEKKDGTCLMLKTAQSANYAAWTQTWSVMQKAAFQTAVLSSLSWIIAFEWSKISQKACPG